MDDSTFWTQLAAPMAADCIRVKVQATSKDGAKGLIVAYIDARAVEERLDGVCTPGGWYDDYTPIDAAREPTLRCHLTVKAPGDGPWITKTGIGDTGQNDSFKDAESDALKRAAVKFGIGRELYGFPKFWVPVEKRGKGTYIKDEAGALRRMLAEAGHHERSNVDRRSQAAAPAKTNGSAPPLDVGGLVEWADEAGVSKAKLVKMAHDAYGVGRLDELTRDQAVKLVENL